MSTIDVKHTKSSVNINKQESKRIRRLNQINRARVEYQKKYKRDTRARIKHTLTTSTGVTAPCVIPQHNPPANAERK